MADHLTAIARTVESTSAHHTHSRAYGYGSLSEFVCSCGEVFTPSYFDETPREWPSLVALHRAFSVAEAAVGDLELPYLADLDDVRIGSVFHGSDHRLYRRLKNNRWLGQDGQRLDDEAVAQLTLTLIWSPTA